MSPAETSAAAATGRPRWDALATWVSEAGARLDPQSWRTGEPRLSRDVVISIDALELPDEPDDRPARLDVDVRCGETGGARFHAWTWRADDPSDGSRSLSFVAPVDHDEDLRLELAVDGEPPLLLHLHAGDRHDLPKLQTGRYEIELHRPDGSAETTRLRLAIAARD